MINYTITKRAIKSLPKDKQFIKDVLTDVKDTGKYWEITSGIGSMIIPKVNTDFEPRVGMNVTYYGKGFGFTVRGVVINDVIFYYRTPEESQKDHEKYFEKQNNDKKAIYKWNKAKYDKMYKSYPDVFKRRIDRFRANNPDFNWEHLSYELYCCNEAIKIANKLKTVEQIDRFREMSWEAQRMLVDIDSDHSGNTFSCAVGLAKLYLTNPKDVVKAHGALCCLVGCKDYGCVKKDFKDE